MVQYIYTLGADLISQERGGRTYTYLYDGHGSVVGLADESGKVTDTYTYDAFGNLLKSTGRTQNNYRYCGEQFDSTTGLYYLRARYMDTNTGRFISQDTYAGSVYDPVSLHKYLYCNSDPVNNVDPSGYTAGSLTDTQVAMAGMTIVAAGLIAYNNTVLNIGLSLINALKGIAYEVNALFDDLEALITDLSSGSKTSVDVNAEVREEAVGDAAGSVTGKAEKESDDEQDDNTSVEESDGNDLEGPPNQTLPRTNKDGKVIGDRTYGSDGKADVDTDYTDHGNPKQHPKVPHKHKWDWSNPNKPTRSKWY